MATVKNKDRKELFAEVGYPPEPVITRWATWLKAALYYADKLPEVRRIVEGFEGDGLLVTKARATVANPQITENLLAIKRDYSVLVELLEKCQSTSYTMIAAHNDLQGLKLGMDCCGIKSYICKRLQNNPSFLDIIELKRTDISPALYELLQKCQPTSISVERSFSILKKMLATDRNFKAENVEFYCMMLYNSSNSE